MFQTTTISIKCPNLACRKVLAVPANARGRLVRCRACGKRVRVPMPKVETLASTGEPVTGPMRGRPETR